MKTKLKIISVVGARPQFIKLSPIAEVLSKKFNHYVVHTGQHYDFNMSDLFFKQLKIPRANINLQIKNGSHGEMTGNMLKRLEKVYQQQKPDFVLVYGDTNSTLAGALAAAKLSIPVGHVEAGLRSFVDDMPEEINRKLCDHISQLLFCPTTVAINNLKSEGIKKKIIRSGDLMYELLDNSLNVIKKNARISKKYKLEEKEYLFLTLHRAANVDTKENLEKIISILESVKYTILFPIHPRTRKRFTEFKLLKRLNDIDNLILTEPLGYHDSLSAAYNAKFVLTDSGGLQKEAIFLGTPVLTLRNETEWIETLKNGNCLVALNKNKILKNLRSIPAVKKTNYKINNKKPSKIIADELNRFLRGK